MNTIIQRVYLCQIVSLGLLFKELNDMQKVAARNGECFENLAGNIYMRSLMTDFAASMIQLCFGYIFKWARYIRYVRGGFLGLKEPMPRNIAVVLTRQNLPEYDAKEVCTHAPTLCRQLRRSSRVRYPVRIAAASPSIKPI